MKGLGIGFRMVSPPIDDRSYRPGLHVLYRSHSTREFRRHIPPGAPAARSSMPLPLTSPKAAMLIYNPVEDKEDKN